MSDLQKEKTLKQTIEVICPSCKKTKKTIFGSDVIKNGQLLRNCFDCWMAEKRKYNQK